METISSDRKNNLMLKAFKDEVVEKFNGLKHVPIWKQERPQSIDGGDELKVYRSINEAMGSRSSGSDLLPIKVIEEEKNADKKQSTASIVSDAEKNKSHWLDGNDGKPERSPVRGRRGGGRENTRSAARGRRGGGREETAKFPWSSMRSASK